MLEKSLIEYCAPTLAALKSANLFNYRFESRDRVLTELDEINGELNCKGVYVEPLLWKRDTVLIYAYRQSLLEAELMQEGVSELLMQYGYTECSIKGCLKHLKMRLYQYDCFPHEIGIFLGYPLMDVIGFIRNEGKNCKCCGIWKVYCDESEAKKKFDKLRKCTRVYAEVFSTGRSLTQMTVCA